MQENTAMAPNELWSDLMIVLSEILIVIYFLPKKDGLVAGLLGAKSLIHLANSCMLFEVI